MIWQHCGRLGSHEQHVFVARQAIVVELCTCDQRLCECESSALPRFRKQEKLRCPGKQVRSVEIPVTTEVKT